MHIIVAGAGSIGFQMTRVLVENRQDVVVIDRDREVCETIYAETGAMTIHGDVTDIRILEKAGAVQADAILCLARADGDNIACVVLSKTLGVPTIIALLRQPRYESAYYSAGATSVIHVADLLLNQILIELEQPEVKKIMALGGGKAEIYTVNIPPGAKSLGMTIAEIAQQTNFPKECVFVGIYHEEEDKFIIPRGEHAFEAGESICLVSKAQHIKQVTDFLTKTR